MGFNYGYEKKKFDSKWKRLEVEYCDAGMSEEQIAAMKEYDWAWFCSQRVFQNHTQPIPCEQYDEVCGQSQLFRKFASLSYQWDVDKIDQTRYGWLASVEKSKRMMTTIKLNLSFSMGLNFLAIALAITGILNPVVGALVHNAGSVLVIINSALLLKWRKRK